MKKGELNFLKIFKSLRISLLLWLVGLILNLSSLPISSAQTTWTGAVSTEWNLAGNWTAGIPNNEAVTIPGSVASGRYPVISSSVPAVTTILINSAGVGASLTVNTGGALTATNLITINAEGTFIVNDGTLALDGITSSGTLNVNGGLITSTTADITIAAGTFNQTSGTVTISNGPNLGKELKITGGTVNQSGGTISSKNYGPTVGAFNQTGSSAVFDVTHDWKPQTGHTFNSSAGTVRFSGNAGGGATFISTNVQFFNVIVDAGVNPGFSADPNSLVKIAGDFTNNNTGLNVTNNATFTFNGTGHQTIISASTGANRTFGHLVINNPSDTVTMNNAIGIAGNFTMTDGTFNPQTHLLTIVGTFNSFAGGTIRVGAATFAGNYSKNPTPSPGTLVDYYALGNQTVSTSFQYSNLKLQGSGNKAFNTAVTVNNILDLFTPAVAILPNNTTSFCNVLKFEGVPQVTGSWGGTISPAANVSATYFGTTTTGIINNQTYCIGIWEGNVSTSWHNPQNWCSDFVPTIATPVIIPSGTARKPVIFTTASCASILLGNGATNDSITISGSSTLTVAGSISFGGVSGVKRIVFTGSGTLNIGGDLNSGGSITPGTGTVRFNGNDDQNIANYSFYNITINKSSGIARLLGNTTATRLLNMTNGTLDMSNFNLTVGSLTGAGDLTNLTGTAGARTLTVGTDDTSPQAYSGIISNGTASSVSLIKAGTAAGSTGKLILSGANTYTGSTTVSKGILNIQNSNALGATGTGTTVLSGASLQLEGDFEYAAEPLTMAGEGPNPHYGALRNESGENTWTGPITLADSARIESSDDSGGGILFITGSVTLGTYRLRVGGDEDVDISGLISGASGIRKGVDAGTGTLTLSGANTYTGQTFIEAGAISVGSINSTGPSQQPSSNLGRPNSLLNGTIQMGKYGSPAVSCALVYTGTGESTNRIVDLISPTSPTNCIIDNSGSGTLVFTSNFTGSTGSYPGTLTLQGFNTGANAISGSIPNLTGGTQPLALVKAGSGTWILSGPNAFSGGTTISEGLLGLGAAGVLHDAGEVILNGGTLSSGISSGFSETMGTLALLDNSILDLGSGVHSLNFAASDGVAWNSGKILTITGWVGDYLGSSGAEGKIFVGNNTSGLTAAQLNQILFLNQGVYYPAKILSTGEVVPYLGGYIYTGSITGSPFCAGESGINVPFTYTPAYLFPVGITTFTAQLSDATGSFILPVILQSVASDTSGSQSISVTIPPLTPSGTGYRIRVVSDDPSATSTDNGSDLTISLPTISGNLTVSIGGTTQLTGSGTPHPTTPWTSASPGVASVNGTGLVTGISEGTSLITYRDINNCTASVTVTVLGINNFNPGAYIIDMGQATQTIANGLKPYGLVHALLTVDSIPVYWAIDQLKAKDAIDFTLPAGAGGKSYRGGSFIIKAESVTPSVLDRISDWIDLGVVVDGPISTGFTAPIYKELTIWPLAYLDAQNDGLITPYYSNAGIPTSSYVTEANPSMLPPCGSLPGTVDIYILPHADPDNWDEEWITDLLNFNITGGDIWGGCHAVSVLENLPGCNFLSNSGLVPFGSHDNGTPPYTYNPLDQIPGHPIMQFIGTLDGTTTNGSEQIYVPLAAGWRETTKIAVYDATYTSGGITYTYPDAAAILAYGHAFGDSTRGTVMYEAGHSLNKGTIAERVAAQRAYFNFLLLAGSEPMLNYYPPDVGDQETYICSGETFNFVPDGMPPNVTYTWTAPTGSGFTGGAAQTVPQPTISGTLVNTTSGPVTAVYTVTPAIGACVGNPFLLSVTIYLVPVIPEQVAEVCSGESFLVSPVNNPPGTIVPPGTTYNWPDPIVTGGMTGGAPGIGAPNISGTLINSTSTAQSATYTVTPISPDGPCMGVPFTVVVWVDPLPVTEGDTLCQGGSGAVISSTECDFEPVTIGPANAGNGASVAGVGSVGWTNAQNAVSNNDQNATITLNNQTSNYLRTTNYGFNLPAEAIITGITVYIGRRESGIGTGTDVRDAGVYLLKAGSIVGNNHAYTADEWPATEQEATYGGPSDTWGTAWSAGEVNASNFGVSLHINSVVKRDAFVDYIIVSVTYFLDFELNWYTVSSGGTPIGTGSPFNPVGVDPTLPNTNTPGTWTYYAACSSYPDCRTAANFVILPAPECIISGEDTLCPSWYGNIYSAPAGMTAYSWGITGNGIITGPTNGQTVSVTAGNVCGPFDLSLMVTDDVGCTSTCSLTVSVHDTISPQISCPPDVLHVLAIPGEQYAEITTDPPSYIDNCSVNDSIDIAWEMTGATIDNGTGFIPSDYPFNVDTTFVTYTATDQCGNTGECQFIVVVDPYFAPEIECPPNILVSTDPGVCNATLDPGAPVLLQGTELVEWKWVMSGATEDSNTTYPIEPIPYTFNLGTTYIMWIAWNLASSDTCIQTVIVEDTEPPTFNLPDTAVTHCANNIITAIYNFNPTPGIIPEYDDVTEPRPEYYLFSAGSTVFNLDPVLNEFADNCCVTEDSIHWRLELVPTPDPSTPGHEPIDWPDIPDQVGQPSLYPGDIELPADGVYFTDVTHRLYYRLVDCNGVSSEEKILYITVSPRPNVIKIE